MTLPDDPDLDAFLTALDADEAAERRLKLEAALSDEDEGSQIVFQGAE